jgi:hypothetical protein
VGSCTVHTEEQQPDDPQLPEGYDPTTWITDPTDPTTTEHPGGTDDPGGVTVPDTTPDHGGDQGQTGNSNNYTDPEINPATGLPYGL